MSGDVLLAIDSATTRVVVALGRSMPDGLIDATDWPAGYRHGETLLPAIDELLGRTGIDRTRLAAIVVGTGPGRVHRPARRDRDRQGPGARSRLSDRRRLDRRGAAGRGHASVRAAAAGRPVGSAAGPPRRACPPRPGRHGAGPRAGTETLVAVDLADRAPGRRRGTRARPPGPAWPPRSWRSARTGCAPARWTTSPGSSPSTSRLPRGVRSESGEVAWSHDRP